MKRIGLLTVHCSKNPGASLQAYALAHKIKDCGGNVTIINYCPEYFLDIMDPFKKKTWTWRERLKNLIIGSTLKKRYELFQRFNKDYLPMTGQRYSRPEDLASEKFNFDVFICGSDQIWNPVNVKQDTSFFFDFVKKTQVRIASYAASIGQDFLNDAQRSWLDNGLKRFDFISVREIEALNLLTNELNYKDAIQCIDPTLLYSGTFWRNYAVKPSCKMPEHYILFYPIQYSDLSIQLISALKTRESIPCVSLDGGIKKVAHADRQIRFYGPCQFLWLIDRADYIITNSFHGLALSLLLKKRVLVYKHTTRNSRLTNLLSLTNLSELQVESVEEAEQIDWQEVTRKLSFIEGSMDSQRESAEAYLRKVIGE